MISVECRRQDEMSRCALRNPGGRIPERGERPRQTVIKYGHIVDLQSTASSQ
jgi:hypothetical protein